MNEKMLIGLKLSCEKGRGDNLSQEYELIKELNQLFPKELGIWFKRKKAKTYKSELTFDSSENRTLIGFIDTFDYRIANILKEYKGVSAEMITVSLNERRSCRLLFEHGKIVDKSTNEIHSYEFDEKTELPEEAIYEFVRLKENYNKATYLVKKLEEAIKILKSFIESDSKTPSYIILDYPEHLNFENPTDIGTLELLYSI